MDIEQIKIAFLKAKQDVLSLGNELSNLRSEVSDINEDISRLKSEQSDFYNSFSGLSKDINDLKEMIRVLHEEMNNQKMHELSSSPIYIVQNQGKKQAITTDQQTNQHIFPTNTDNKTENPTVPQEIRGLNNQNMSISTGNEGVPTDQQTVRQTIRQTEISTNIPDLMKDFDSPEPNIETNIKEAKIILDSLDRLKKEIRSKFKRLTPQEMLVFSTIYQSEESDPENTTYRSISKRLKLSESSIRDYTLRIISKGIPLKKRKIDNKKVVLFISSELKKIATLSTIIQLRDL
jgi:hypothetical protein